MINRRTLAARLALFAFVAGSAPAVARANWFNLYTPGGRAAALGGAMTAAADDWTATFYNPALLATIPEATLGVGVGVAAPALHVAMSNPNPAVDPRLPPTYWGISAGASVPFTGNIGKRVAFGFAAFLPGANILLTHLQDPLVPTFYMYDAAPSGLVLDAGLGVRIVDWLQVGLGVEILASLGGPANITVDLANRRFPYKEINAALVPAFAAIAGISLRPVTGLTIGLSYRGQIGIGIDIPANISIDGLDAQLGLRIHGTTDWTPHTISAGIAYKLQPIPLFFTLDASYALWSLAPDPSLQVELGLSGADAQKLGLVGVLDSPSKGNERFVRLGFSNTSSARLGVEFDALQWLILRGSYGYRPTPAPLQTSGTNILDNDTHTLGFGLGFRFKDPLQFLTGVFNIDLSGQALLMPQRNHTKDTPDDPVGDLSAGGAIYTVSLALRYTLGP